MFDDPRYFQPASERRLFNLGGCKLGVPICEDFWNDKTFWKQRLYANDPAEELITIFMTQLLPSSAYPVRRELRTMVYAAITDSNL